MDDSFRRRWPEVRALYEDALMRPRPERAAFVQAHAADVELAAAVESLLAAEDPETLGATMVAAATGGSGPRAVDDSRGLRIGPFELETPLGAGGMGEVWQAQRVGGDFAQTVAVKLLHRGLEHADAARRFVQERQILAGLEHPAIARLIDGGVATDGRLWYAMEKIDGMPITAHAAERALDVRARVALLADVAGAVAAAQEAGVVHRDLKPSNILVDAAGRARLLDFGIAKWLEPSRDVDATATGWPALTPSHAAPEQILGSEISRATDVWALGVVAYELLTGRLPFDRAAVSLAALAERAREEAAVAPSRAVKGWSAADAARIDAALDRIVLQCLEVDPARRYPDAAALTADLRRWLAGEPVLARGIGPWRQWRRRWRQVGRWLLPAALMVAVVALGWAWTRPAGAPVIGPVIADEAALDDSARAHLASARAALEVGDDAGYLKAREELAELVARAPDYLAGSVALADVIARLSLVNLIDREEGLREVRRLSGQAMARHPADFDTRVLVARLGYLEAEFEFSSPKMLAALRVHEALLRERPDDLGTLQTAMQAAGGIGQLEQVVAYGERADAVRPDGRTAAMVIRALTDLGRFDEAEAVQAQALERWPRRADLYGFLTQAYLRLGRWREALTQIERCELLQAERCAGLRSSLAILLRIPQPPAPPAAPGSFGAALASGGYAAALAFSEQEERAGRAGLLRYWSPLAAAALAEGRWDGVLEVLGRQMPGLVAGDPPGPHVSVLVVMIGVAHKGLGDAERARADFERALAASELLPETTRAKLGQVPDVLALAWLGRTNEALDRLERYIEMGWSSERTLMEPPCAAACRPGPVRPDPLIAPLHGEPRFQALMTRVRERNAAALAQLRRDGLLPLAP